MRRNFSVFLNIFFLWPLFFTGRYSAVDLGKAGNWSIGSSGGQQYVNLWGNVKRNGTYLYLPVQQKISSVSILAKNISSGTASYPILGISDNKNSLIDSVKVSLVSWAWYRMQANFYADTLFIFFVNDQWTPGVLDVNVAVDSIIVETAAGIDTFQADSVRVYWLRNQERDLENYRVYVGYQSRQYKFYWETADTELSFIPFKDTTNYVAVTAVDTAGNESDYSNEAVFYVKTRKLPDVSPPTIPILDRIIFYGNQIDSIVVWKKK